MDPVTSWLITNFLIPSGIGAGIASLFGGSGREATPMTPEEAAEFEAESRLALASSGLAEGGEGAYESLMDALAQASDTENVSQQEIADILGASGFASVPTLGGSTEPTLVEMTQEKINKAASAVGKAQDTLFDIFGIPKPDYSVIQPNAPGATVIWGEPSGGVFGRIGTTPGGTVTGVQTGIPALDVVLGKVADVVSGRTAAGEVLTTATIQEIILQTAGDELGIPGDPNKILADIKEIGSQVFYDENTGKIGIDLGDGPDLGSTDDLVPDNVTLPTDDLVPTNDIAAIRDIVAGDVNSDRAVINTGTRDIVAGDVSSDRAVINTGTRDIVGSDKALVFDTPTLSTGGDRTLTIPDFDPFETERTPTLTTDEVPTPAAAGGGGGGGGGGLGETGGIRTVSGGPGPLVDIDYLYDFEDSLLQPFRVTDDEDEIEGRRVRRFNGTTGSEVLNPGVTAQDYFDATSGNQGNTGVRGKLSQFVGDNAGALLTSAVGGLFGLLDNDEQQPAGYQGAIPDYQFNRTLKENAFSAVNPDGSTRRPGSMGRSYFDYGAVPFTGTGVMQGVGIPAAVATDTGGIAGLDTSALTSTGNRQEDEEAVAEATAQQLAAQQLAAQQAAGADGNGVVSNSVLDGFGEVVNTTGTGQLTSAQLKQAVLDGTMDYNTAYGLLGIADAVNPFGFTEDEKLTLGISESQRTGQGYKQNPTTGAMDLYDYDTNTFVTETGNTTTTDTTDSNAAFNTFISPFYNQSALTPAQLIQLGDSGYDLATIASKLGVDATALSNAIAQATSAAQTQSIFDAVDPTDGFSREEQDSIANLILEGKTGIGNVAGQYENVSDMDVIEGLLRGGYESPAAMTERLAPTNTGLTEVQLMASLLSQGRTTPEELAGYYGNNPDYPEYAGITAADVRGFAKDLGIEGYAQGGDINGYYLGGTTDGMADQIPATIDNNQPAALSDGEFVIPADVVSHLGNGNSDAGAKNLYSMMDRIRVDRTGNPNQGRQINPNKYLA